MSGGIKKKDVLNIARERQKKKWREIEECG